MSKKRVSAQNRSQRSDGHKKLSVSRKSNGNGVLVKGEGVRTSGASRRVAKTSAKNLIRYKTNVSLIANSSDNVSTSSSAIRSKTRAKLETKYKNIKSDL